MTNKNKILFSPQIKKIVDFMDNYHKEHEAWPKLNEIAQELKVSKQRIGVLMKLIERLGLIKSSDVFMRKYSLTELSKRSKLKVNNYYEL
jgi:SOS-response transcriptional repressor LexA